MVLRGVRYGLKLHLVTNQYGELVRFLITPASVADNNQEVLSYLFKGLSANVMEIKAI